MISVVERSLYEVGGDDPLALDVDVAADVAVVAGRHQHCSRFRRHLLKYFFFIFDPEQKFNLQIFESENSDNIIGAHEIFFK